MEYGHALKTCRMCGSGKLYQFLDLGFQPPSDRLLTKEDLHEPEVVFPLTVLQCEDCGLTQLGYVVKPEFLYGSRYKYESSITESGKKHFFSMANSISQKCHVKKGSLVVDIGSNVGVLLEGFKNNGMNVLGVDPATQICNIANGRGIETLNALMGMEVAEKIKREKGRASIVTGTNVFAHIDDKDGLMKSLDVLLEDDGVFIFEAPYLVDLLENLEYDTIYLEHLEYISIKPLIPFFAKYGMEIFDIEKYDIHGTSVRVFISRKGKKPASSNVAKFLALEQEKNIYSKTVLDDFAKKVALQKQEIVTLLNQLKKEGKTIIGISAPAKGNTMLNYCNIDTQLLDFITEKSIIKKGCYTPGMHIPIVGEEKMFSAQGGSASGGEGNIPDYGIIFAWNFAEEIIKNNKAFSDRGGKFIIPIPHPIIQ